MADWVASCLDCHSRISIEAETFFFVELMNLLEQNKYSYLKADDQCLDLSMVSLDLDCSLISHIGCIHESVR